MAQEETEEEFWTSQIKGNSSMSILIIQDMYFIF